MEPNAAWLMVMILSMILSMITAGFFISLCGTLAYLLRLTDSLHLNRLSIPEVAAIHMLALSFLPLVKLIIGSMIAPLVETLAIADEPALIGASLIAYCFSVLVFLYWEIFFYRL